MSRLVARTTQVFLDLAVLSAAIWLAFLLRFDWDLPLQMFKRMMFVWPYVVAAQYVALMAFGVPRFAWRYVGLRETSTVLVATAASSGALLCVRAVSAVVLESHRHAQYAMLPIGVILIDFLLAFLAIVGIRAVRRVHAERADAMQRPPKNDAVPTMLVGAGHAGRLIVQEIAGHPSIGIRAVGFLDDDPIKVGTVLHGLPVLGTTADLAASCRKHGAEQVLIAIASARGKDIRRIKDLCDDAGIAAKIIPGIHEIVGGQVNLSRIREVTIEDLLGREPIVLESDDVAKAIRDRVVLVSGAGGSIGSELTRQICSFGPKKLILLEQAENSLFEIHRELVAKFPDLAEAIIPRIGDICDGARMEKLFGAHRPEIVYHAAAHKHVPMMELNPGEAVKNNVFGTKTLADVSHASGVREFVMISTDKAVNPTSVMGVAKRTAEIYIQALSERSNTRFVTVRFGNVLGSAGSVVPIFQKQIAAGGPVTVTHPAMTRYFMTIPEACQLVLQAGTMGKGGEIFILDMGEPVKIVDLARDLIRLSGLRPDEDIEIRYTGTRPGEKLFEELSVAEEHADTTRHPKIFIGRFRAHDWDSLCRGLLRLESVADKRDHAAIRSRFRDIVPEYAPATGDLPVERPRVVTPVVPSSRAAMSAP